MADAISSIANVQLGLLQSPEVAREYVPVAMQEQIANAQAPAIIEHYDQEALETVQQLQETGSHGVPDALSGHPDREQTRERRQRRRLRLPEPAASRAASLAAAHPRGLGATVDVRA